MASRPKKGCQVQHYEPLPSSDEESESSSTQLSTKANIQRQLMRRNQEHLQQRRFTMSPRSNQVLLEHRRRDFKRRWSLYAGIQTMFQMCSQLFCWQCKSKGREECPWTSPPSLSMVHQVPTTYSECQECSSEDGKFIEHKINCHQRNESGELTDHDDEFSTAVQNTREHSSEPDMVNGVDVLQNYQQYNERESIRTHESNPLQLAIPQHVKQNCAPSALVISEKSYSDLRYKDKKEVLRKPRFVMFEAAELLGEFMNAIVTHVVRFGRVNFCGQSLVCTIPGEKQVTVFQERPVFDPSDKDQCPEAFDPRNTLSHINVHLPIYSPFIGLGLDLKSAIEREISKNWCAKNLSWDSAITSMTITENFMEQVINGLDINESPDLVESLQDYLEKIRAKIDIAKYVQQLS